MVDYKNIIINEACKNNFTRVEVALEYESMRVIDGKISQENHPKTLEPKLSHKYITTDFSESQIELITPILCNSQNLSNFVNTLYDITALELKENEYLFPYSMPPKINSVDEIREAFFDTSDPNAEKFNSYRKYLTGKYGKKKQTISGIHFNFSLCDKLVNSIEAQGISKNDIYLKIIRNYNKYKFLTVALLGASPVCDDSFTDDPNTKMVSIRNSHLGYRNLNKLNIDYGSTQSFIDSVNKLIANNTIIDERELYEPIRIKTKSKNLLDDLKNDKIRYVEIRNIDINPYEKGGISVDQIKMLKYIVLYCLIKDENESIINDGDAISDFVAENYDFETKIPFMNNMTILELLKNTLNDMLANFNSLGIEAKIISKYIDNVNNNDFLYQRVYEDINKYGYNEFLNSLSEKYKTDAYNNRFKLYGNENMELSTQILMKESIKKSVDVKVIDGFDNFIMLSKDDKTEYIKQATKTSIDNYVTVCAMENKVVTKKILDTRGIKVPKGSDFIDFDSAFKYAENMQTGFVVKPKSTNFGIGINIFKDNKNIDVEDIKKAIDIAFSHDDTIIIEEFISGDEYRFLVIGDEAVGVLNRVPANVCGDGKSTITELVAEKNKDSLRGKGYKTPLEKIVIDDNVKIFLNAQNKDENYVPNKDEIVYLRHNSNISTGGDSVDITDEVHERFKQIAVDATKAIGAKICGVDIIIEDYRNEDSNYSIIELNFNPAIHIHSYPYKGVERNIAKSILQLLDFVK